jgi:hypothetical protein
MELLLRPGHHHVILKIFNCSESLTTPELSLEVICPKAVIYNAAAVSC